MYDGKKKVVGYTWDDGNGNGKWQPELLIENYAPGDRWFTYRIEVQERHGPHLSSTTARGSREGREDGRCRGTAATSRPARTPSPARRASPAPQADDFGEALFRSIVVEVDRV